MHCPSVKARFPLLLKVPADHIFIMGELFVTAFLQMGKFSGKNGQTVFQGDIAILLQLFVKKYPCKIPISDPGRMMAIKKTAVH